MEPINKTPTEEINIERDKVRFSQVFFTLWLVKKKQFFHDQSYHHTLLKNGIKKVSTKYNSTETVAENVQNEFSQWRGGWGPQASGQA